MMDDVYLFNLYANNLVKMFMSEFSNAIGRKDEGSVASLPSFNNNEILASYNVGGNFWVPNE